MQTHEKNILKSFISIERLQYCSSVWKDRQSGSACDMYIKIDSRRYFTIESMGFDTVSGFISDFPGTRGHDTYAETRKDCDINFQSIKVCFKYKTLPPKIGPITEVYEELHSEWFSNQLIEQQKYDRKLTLDSSTDYFHILEICSELHNKHGFESFEEKEIFKALYGEEIHESAKITEVKNHFSKCIDAAVSSDALKRSSKAKLYRVGPELVKELARAKVEKKSYAITKRSFAVGVLTLIATVIGLLIAAAPPK